MERVRDGQWRGFAGEVQGAADGAAEFGPVEIEGSDVGQFKFDSRTAFGSGSANAK